MQEASWEVTIHVHGYTTCRIHVLWAYFRETTVYTVKRPNKGHFGDNINLAINNNIMFVPWSIIILYIMCKGCPLLGGSQCMDCTGRRAMNSVR